VDKNPSFGELAAPSAIGPSGDSRMAKASKKSAGTERLIRARNKKAVLDAAIGVFTRKGYEGASIAEIASLAGLPKANVYYYFKSKKAIYTTIIADLIDAWDAALAHLSPERDPADALTEYIHAKLEFSRKHPEQSKMFANEAVHGGRFLTRGDRAHMQAITVKKANVFRTWAKAGRMDPVHPMHFFIMLWAATQFYADFEVLACNALGKRRLTRAEYDIAAETLKGIFLKGSGVGDRSGLRSGKDGRA
jgi:TetR/AcrR family transcriptional regulator